MHWDNALKSIVFTFSREHIMLGLAQNEDDIARFDAGLLVGIAAEGDLVPIRHALVNVHLEHFLFFKIIIFN